MSEQGSPESHGVYGGTERGDGKMQEEPRGVDGVDEQEWEEKTESGGEAT
ncbi:MAG: hypothetical protein M3203_10740 [Actinomycetota bacterium]|nr:hypothetical protein [Actinomycetota bacterium]